MTTTERSRPLGYTLLLLNGASAALLLIIAVGFLLAVFADAAGGIGEPDDTVANLLVLLLAGTLFAGSWAMTRALARHVREVTTGGAGPVVSGAIVLLLLALLVALGVSVASGASPIGMFVMVPLVGLAGGALYVGWLTPKRKPPAER